METFDSLRTVCVQLNRSLIIFELGNKNKKRLRIKYHTAKKRKRDKKKIRERFWMLIFGFFFSLIYSAMIIFCISQLQKNQIAFYLN
jgi:hypothetical protein